MPAIAYLVETANLAARHRVLRLLDPSAASALRSAHHSREAGPGTDIPVRVSRAARIRAQMAVLIGAANDRPVNAA